jgi:cation diffusion facilitator CzcD-associated flavoprotein CzcO
MLFSNQWYPALAQPNVDVVTDTVAEVVPEGIVTADGRVRPVDVVVYGTGFKATDFLAPITVRGRGGQDLHEQWREGSRAYLGMAVPGFPNMFVIYGPNTNLGSSSIILMIEQQARYIRQVVEELARTDRTVAVDVRREVHEAYDDEIMRRLGESVWSGCDSWYKADSGRITTNWPGLVHEYQRRTRTADPADFETIAPRRATEPSGI